MIQNYRLIFELIRASIWIYVSFYLTWISVEDTSFSPVWWCITPKRRRCSAHVTNKQLINSVRINIDCFIRRSEIRFCLLQSCCICGCLKQKDALYRWLSCYIGKLVVWRIRMQFWTDSLLIFQSSLINCIGYWNITIYELELVVSG